MTDDIRRRLRIALDDRLGGAAIVKDHVELRGLPVDFALFRPGHEQRMPSVVVDVLTRDVNVAQRKRVLGGLGVPEY